MRKPTKTIRISSELKDKLDETKGKNLSHNKFIAYLLEFFLTKK